MNTFHSFGPSFIYIFSSRNCFLIYAIFRISLNAFQRFIRRKLSLSAYHTYNDDSTYWISISETLIKIWDNRVEPHICIFLVLFWFLFYFGMFYLCVEIASKVSKL